MWLFIPLLLIWVCGFDVEAGSSSIFKGCEHYNLAQSPAEPQPGMHLLCLKHDGKSSIHVSMLKDGHEEREFVFSRDTGDDFVLFAYIDELLGGSSNNRVPKKWKAFNALGRRLWSVDRMAFEEIALIYTNGHFMWPGVRPGHKFRVSEDTELTTLSLRPLVFRSENFLTDEECDYIVELSKPHLVASKTSKMDKDRDKPDTTWRTSTQYFLPSKGNDIVQNIDWRVAQMTKTTVPQQELVQVLRYEKGQKYDHHTDYFDARFYQSDPETLRTIENGEKNRLITVLWYLSTITDGGHTVFPRAFGEVPPDTSDCSTGLRVSPTKGEVIVFYSLTADGAIDPLSVHGACPVGEGVKWAANKWVWTGPTGQNDEEEWDGEEDAYDDESEAEAEEEDEQGDEDTNEEAGEEVNRIIIEEDEL